MSGLIEANNRLYMNDQVAAQLGKRQLTPAERLAAREQERLAREAERVSRDAAKKVEDEARAKEREEKKAAIKTALEADAKLEAAVEAYGAHNTSLEPTDAKIRQLTHAVNEDLKSIEELTSRIAELQLRKERIVKERERKIDERATLSHGRHIDNTKVTADLQARLLESNAAWGPIQTAKRKELRNRKAKRLALEILGQSNDEVT